MDQRSLIVGCVVIAICGVVLPLLAFYQLPEVKSHYAGFGILAVAGAAWIFGALRRRNYGAVVARMVILLLVVDLYIQGFIFPVYNRFQTRPVAERLGTIVKPGDGVAIFQSDPLDNCFNFYSGIKHIEHIDSQEGLSEYLSRPGGRFLLVKQRKVETLQKSTDRNLTFVAIHQPSAKCWFPRAFLVGCSSIRAFRHAPSLQQRSGSCRLHDGLRIESVAQSDRHLKSVSRIFCPTDPVNGNRERS
jgi:hypothetical protein